MDVSLTETEYSVRVPLSQETVTVTPVAFSSDATIVVAGQSVSSGKSSGPIAVTVGYTAIDIVVSHPSGLEQTYDVTVQRAAENLVQNSSADDELEGWSAHGNVTAYTMPASGRTVFSLESTDSTDAYLVQDIDLPAGAGGKYLLVIGYGWVAYATPDTTSGYPYLYGYELDAEGGPHQLPAGHGTWCG